MRYHFIGIKGSGMASLAELVRAQGHEVTGSDLSDTGHNAAHVEGAERVIFTPAVRESSPGWVELAAAREKGIPTLRSDELIAELTKGATVVAIAGMHGKSTTTAMVGQILEAAGRNPTVYIGAPVLAWGGRQYRTGDPSLWVVEADEYERKFLSLHPTVAVVTNIEPEHLDIYRDLADIEQAFAEFLSHVKENGTIVGCVDSSSVAQLLARVDRHGITVRSYSSQHAEYEPSLLPELSVPGAHNRLNALAALAAVEALGVDRAVALNALVQFQGAGRRLEYIGERNGVTVIDDYGHHPTELRVSIQAIRDRYPGRRLVVAFQPHQHARLKALFTDFSAAFMGADLVWITDVYAVPGREEADRVESQTLVDAIQVHGEHSEHVGSLEQLAQKLDTDLKPNDVLLTIGATDITKVGRAWIKG